MAFEAMKDAPNSSKMALAGIQRHAEHRVIIVDMETGAEKEYHIPLSGEVELNNQLQIDGAYGRVYVNFVSANVRIRTIRINGESLIGSKRSSYISKMTDLD